MYRISALNPGMDELIIYDVSSGKYLKMTNANIDASEKVVNKLKALYGEANVVVK